MRRAVLICSLFVCWFSNAAYALERITRFHSEIVVLEDRSLEVIETIAVIAENQSIRHGIYRDLPTIYAHPKWGNLGIREKTKFKIKSVLLDGQSSPWHQIALPNGIRIYIGDKNKFVARGAHEYEIRYSTQRQLSRFEGADYLNWNVNGQDWQFPVDSLSATFHLPLGARPLATNAWLGKSGSREQAYRVYDNPDGSTTFEASRKLTKFEGMTVLLHLPQNAVSAPVTETDRLLIDNFKWLMGLALLIFLPIYYIKAWLAVGRDPEKGVVVADYHPVRDMSPAAHHFITHNRSNNETFAAALLNMAVKGFVKIEQHGKNDYTVYKLSSGQDNIDALSEGEAILYANLFGGQNRIKLDGEYQPKLARAKKKLGVSLKREWRAAIYQNNQWYSWFGLILGLVALVLCGLHLANNQLKVGHLLPLLIFAFVGLGLGQQSFKPFLLIPVGFFVFAGLQNGAFSLFNSNIMIWLSLFVAALFILFHYLLKAPTPFGQKILDEIEGFRLYLATAEQQRLNVLHPPDKTPELYEKLLPYAIALDVENQWSDQFAEVFKQQKAQGKAYQPSWYSGRHHGGFSGSSIGAAVGAGLAGSVAAASTAPSSSSSGGFSGGAGGGGGGGGGGGW